MNKIINLPHYPNFMETFLLKRGCRTVFKSIKELSVSLILHHLFNKLHVFFLKYQILVIFRIIQDYFYFDRF